MKPRRIFSALLLSLGLILLTFAATCRLVMTNIQIDYDPSSPATVTSPLLKPSRISPPPVSFPTPFPTAPLS